AGAWNPARLVHASWSGEASGRGIERLRKSPESVRKTTAGGRPRRSRRGIMADHQPSFGIALVAVLAGGVVTSWIAGLFIGFDAASSPEAWAIVTSIAGGVAVKAVLRILH